MGYVITATGELGERFFFSGFEGSDVTCSDDLNAAGEMTYWKIGRAHV